MRFARVIPILIALLALATIGSASDSADVGLVGDFEEELALLGSGTVEFTDGYAAFSPCGISLRCDLGFVPLGGRCNSIFQNPPCYCRSLTRFGCKP